MQAARLAPLAGLLLAGLLVANQLGAEPPAGLCTFGQFEQKFHKSYSSPLERARREQIFVKNQARSFVSRASYSSGAASSYLAINHLSDLTRGELRALFARSGRRPRRHLPQDWPLDALGSTRRLGESKLSAARASEPDDSGAHSDADSDADSGFEDADERAPGDERAAWAKVLAEWRRRDSWPAARARHLRDRLFSDLRACISGPARYQGDECGSCAVFSTMALYEWAHCKRRRAKLDLAEQYVLDCAPQLGWHVCEEGILELEVAQFVHDYGFELARHYAYRARELQCPFERRAPARQRGLLRLDRAQLSQLAVYDFERQLERGPIVAGFYLNADTFASYGGGVDLAQGCDWNETAHSMLLVGSGRERGLEYWLVRNSHGDDWGEQGYYRISKLAECYDNAGFGFTLDALRGQANSARLEYRFYENPNYDWQAVARALNISAPKPHLADALEPLER